MTAEELFQNEGRPLVIVLDRTASMLKVIDAFRRFLVRYVIRRVAEDEWSVPAVGLVTFDDHYRNPEERVMWAERDGRFVDPVTPLTVYGMTENLEEFASWLAKVPLGDGYDAAEAIDCAVVAAAALAPEALIWVVTDALPHGTAGRGYGNADDFPNGCPCGLRARWGDVRVLYTRPEVYTDGSMIVQWWREHARGVVVLHGDALEAALTPPDHTTEPARVGERVA